MLTLKKLEDRFCPVIGSPGYFGNIRGYEIMWNNKDFVPFVDFMDSHTSASADGKVVVGAAFGGGPRVQIRDADLNITADVFAFESSFRGGVNVATDGNCFVVGAGVGGGPVVVVMDANGNETDRFFAYDPAFRGGVSVGIIGDKIVTVPI